MNKPYLFTLNNDERIELFEAAETETGLPAYVIEKDYYVTLVLKVLFEELKPQCCEQTSRPFMFKGGTTLSKVFGCINRMSEDIDLSLDMSFLGHPEPPGGESVTKTKKRIEKLTEAAHSTICETIEPFLADHLKQWDPDFVLTVTGNAGTDIEIQYPR
ncbi:hypothetical protein CF392_10615, partial [Tamilnaduibacter salinus]